MGTWSVEAVALCWVTVWWTPGVNVRAFVAIQVIGYIDRLLSGRVSFFAGGFS